MIGIRLWVRHCIICAVLNRNQCHGNARCSNLSDKKETQSAGGFQLRHIQPHRKFACGDLSIHCCASALRFYFQNMLPVRINYARPLDHAYERKKTPLALKIIFAAIPLVLYCEEIKTPQLCNKKSKKNDGEHAKKRQSSNKLLSASILLKIMLVYASSILATTQKTKSLFCLCRKLSFWHNLQ